MNDCVIWTGYRQKKGYGWRGRGLAHRVAYENARGPIPEGMQIDHLCRVKACVNPDHLEAVTGAENMRRRYLLQVACANGHPYDEANTYRRPNGHRDCRACIRDRVRRYRGRTAA